MALLEKLGELNRVAKSDGDGLAELLYAPSVRRAARRT